MDISSSKLLPIIGTVCVVGTLTAGYLFLHRQQTPEPAVVSTPTPTATQPQAADADTPDDTMRALTAEVAELKLQNQGMLKSNEEAKLRKDTLASEVAGIVKDSIQKEQGGRENGSLDALAKRIDELGARLGAATATAASNSAEPNPNGDKKSTEPLAASSLDPDFNVFAKPATVTIEPLNSKTLLEKIKQSVAGMGTNVGAQLSQAGAGLGDNSVLHSHFPGAGQTQAPSTGVNQAVLPEPVYTLPRNATLIGSTGMTALIGRLAFKGNVEDPYPFKVIVGSDNLAANGLEIPGVDGMIFTGNAIGDWALSCVRGNITSVTFVFEDGTIRTLSSDDNSYQAKVKDSALAVGQTNAVTVNTGGQSAGGQGAGGRTGSGNSTLGWLSDRRGVPCISGERISNAPQYLGGRFLARAVGAAGSAYARSQTTVTSSPLTGGFTSGVTGDPAQYALGSLAQGGSDELAQWVAERQAQNYDAVYVDTGAEIVVHIDRELPIDYEPNGRKLAYVRKHHRKQNPQFAKLD